MRGGIGSADGQLGDHRDQRGAHGAGQRRRSHRPRDRLAAGESGGQLTEGQAREVGGLRVSRVRIGKAEGAVPRSSRRRLYGLDSRRMSASGWRIVLITTVPPVAQGLAEALRGLGHQPVAVLTARRDQPVEGPLNMTDGSAPAGVDVLLVASKRAIEPLLRAYAPDLVVCWGFPWRIPLGALQVPRLGSINCHPAMLPRHRGPIPLAWAFRDGDSQYGVTWHRMDAELDTGPILAQARCRWRMTTSTSGRWRRAWAPWRWASCPRCWSAWRPVIRGTRSRPRERPGLVTSGMTTRVDWTQPARRIHDQVRAWQFTFSDVAGGGPVAELDGRPRAPDPHQPGRPWWRRARVETGDGPIWIVAGSRSTRPTWPSRRPRPRRPGRGPPRTSAAAGRRRPARPGPHRSRPAGDARTALGG